MSATKARKPERITITESRPNPGPEIRAMLKRFFPMLFLIALQQLLALFVNLADNFMLGIYSETAMAGAAVVNQLQYMMQQLIFGVAGGVTVLGAQYYGKGDIESIKHCVQVGLRFAFAIGVIFFILTSFFPVQIMSLFTDDGPILNEAVRYLFFMRWTYLLFPLSAVMLYSLQSVQTAHIGAIMSGCTIVINITLNSFLIYGNFGAPEMGIQGAATATIVSRSVELIIILTYLLRFDRKIRFRAREFFGFDRTYLAMYIKVSLPMFISSALWGFSQAVQMALLGHISAQVIGANSVASVIYQVFAVFGIACTATSMAIIGKTVGAGSYDLIKPYARTMQITYLCLGIICGLLLFIFKDPIVGLYDISPETRQLTLSFISILCITIVGTIYEFPAESGIIAGGGSTKYAPVVDNLFMWIWTIPSAYVSAFVFGWPPIVTFALLKSDQLLKCIPNAITVNRFRWVRDVTKHRTTAQEQPE